MSDENNERVREVGELEAASRHKSDDIVVKKTVESFINDNACCICQDFVDILKQGHLSSCDHHFHFDCIVAWAKVTNLCPLCKVKFNEVTREDTQGTIVHREVICDSKQVYRPDPFDHDLAAQLRLVNQARCELCGSGEDEHVLLLCEVLGCGVANHTYCIGLRAVPNTSWYCTSHSITQHRASDVIERPATTVSTRRRTRRLASLMSNVLRERHEVESPARRRRQRQEDFVAVGEVEDRRPIRGIAAVYALRMSRELLQVQQRADAMFARGDLTVSSLYEQQRKAPVARNARRTTRLMNGSTTDSLWEDEYRSRQEVAAAAIATRDVTTLLHQRSLNRLDERSNGVSSTLAPEYCELAKLMHDAVSSDDYASSVTLSIPKTAKLRLVSRVKTFFGRLSRKEQIAVLDLGCLAILHEWIRVPKQSGNEPLNFVLNPQVLETIICILETLPVRKEDLVEEDKLQGTMDSLAELSGIGVESRQQMIKLGEKWRDLNPPMPREVPRPPVVPQVPLQVSSAHKLPLIEAFTTTKGAVQASGKRKRKHEAWADIVVEYVKAKLYPLYKQSNGSGQLTRDRFKSIVKEVANVFSHEAASMQSAVLLPTGVLSNLAKARIKKLIDRVYKASTNGVSIARSSAPLLMPAAMPASTYSAVPSVKFNRRK
ncbi:hypothetical protein CCR75_001359 [Bremia lactucae]|uniref:RING-type domain-containing protein n=1 Tax=Bremia lactucae TaxID=4779 RepID=A0A976FGD2_BRELC|nr:hypothetical protein CCR75_001359 [Bremia lactucae]